MSETRTDPTEFRGDPGRKQVRAGPCGSGRARVVEFSYKDAGIAQASERGQSIRLAEEMRIRVKGKGKVFPYSLPSVGPGADPGVQAVSPQVT